MSAPIVPRTFASITRLEWIELAKQQSARFWSKVNKTETCWLWTRSKHSFGYGKFSIRAPVGVMPRAKHVGAHRISYEMSHGPIPPHLFAMHICDVPSCVNPEHIAVGTPAENSRDSINKGRWYAGERHWGRLHPEKYHRGERHHSHTNPDCLSRGESHYNSKVTESDVREMRRMRMAGDTMVKIAKHFGITETGVYGIVHHRSWKHVK